MFGNLNQAQVMGKLGRDPEIRRTQDGTPVCSLSVATSESWKDKATGERREKTEWHRIVVWGRADGNSLVTQLEKWAQKGDTVFVQGQLQTRKWTDDKGVEKFSTEIVVRGFGHTVDIVVSKKAQASRSERGDGPPMDTTPGREESLASGPPPTGGRPMDDDIPF